MSEMHNPYASPNSTSETPLDINELSGGSPIASQNKRLINYIVDQIVVRIGVGALGFMLGAAYGASKVANGQTITADDETMLNIAGFIVGIIGSIAYFFVLELLSGATIGKLITGTRVVATDGAKASAGQLLGRSFARIIPFEPFSFLFGDKTTGWHDTLSGTQVINIRR